MPPGSDYVEVLWAIWRAGGVAVPLAVSHPPPELERVIDDADPSCIVAHPSLVDRLADTARARGFRLLMRPDPVPGWTQQEADASELPDLSPSRRAMMLYTSGTTGSPKGVVCTHDNLRSWVESMVEAWGWTADDEVLLVLPLHHVHGIVNVLTTALWKGARCRVLAEFDEERVWDHLSGGGLTLFMAVPTIYHRLIRSWDDADSETRSRWSEGAGSLRLMVSGSAALPASTLERWEEITGHRLLERYGMTEIGMALTNPLEDERRAGFVGRPFPGVRVRIVGNDGRERDQGESGELEVRGAGVFMEYWRRPEETAYAFRDGWFRTGDEAVVEDGAYRILGRRSIDIIKTGGYKVSAIEIEEVLRTHPEVRECAVIGVPDEEWGQRVCAVVVVGRASASVSDSGAAARALGPEQLRVWAKERLAPYKIPKEIELLASLPRNSMGKVLKLQLLGYFDPGSDAPNDS